MSQRERQTSAVTLGELLEFLGRNVPLMDKYDGVTLTRREYDVLCGICNKVTAVLDKKELMAVNYLRHALYRDTFVDEEAVSHYDDGEIISASIETLRDMIVLLYIGLVEMTSDYGMKEIDVLVDDVDRIKAAMDVIAPYLNDANQKKLDRLFKSVVGDDVKE